VNRFPNAWAAYEWSYEIMQVFTGGRAFDPDPDRLGQGGTGVLGIVLVAMDIQIAAKRFDIVNGTGSWFERAFLTHETPYRWVGREKRILEDAIVGFCDLLSRKGYFDGCDHEKSGCSCLKIMRLSE